MTTVFEISEINSIRFADQNENIRNYKNELSWQENTAINQKMYAQKALQDDYKVIQVKSNLENLAINLYDLCSTETAIQTPDFIKKTNNIGLIETFSNGLTGSYELDGESKRAVFFDNGELPTYMRVGVEVSTTSTLVDPTTGTYYKIIEIVNDPDRDAYLAVFDVAPASGIDIPRNVAVKYNAQEYEVYEALVDVSGLDGYYFIEVTGNDEDKDYLKVSEIQEVRESFKRTHRIDYRNSKNNGILWATGIGFTLHIPYEVDMKMNTESENESITTDDTLYQTDSSLYPLFTLSFDKMPFGVAKTLSLALAQDSVYVDGIPVIRTESELIPLGSTNEYRLPVTVKQKSEDFTGGVLGDNLELNGVLVADGDGILIQDSDGVLLAVTS